MERTFDLGKGGEMAMVWIGPGAFQMGSPESERSDCRLPRKRKSRMNRRQNSATVVVLS